MYKYKMKEPIMRGEMLRTVRVMSREHFPEILKMTAEHVELLFGIKLKELELDSSSYILCQPVRLHQ